MPDPARLAGRRAPLSTSAQELDSLGRATGVEVEVLDDEPDDALPVTPVGDIHEPFDPDKIDVVTRTPTVDLLLSRIRNNRIDLEPEFQRHRGIWSRRAKSRLIESLLLRIPLPTLYAAETADEGWAVVDGIQRLSAITEFIEPDAIGGPPLVLRDLEYLSRYDGAQFADLPGRLQTRLREAELVLHVIRLGTPEEVKFNIFARINTGGTPLSAQELRHALIGGPARDYLKSWADSTEFKEATGDTIRSERMADREMVLRFVAFYSLGLEEYTSDDFDDYLRRAMRRLNEVPFAEAERVGRELMSALNVARDLFGEHAFRKRFAENRDRRNPVNKALFETVTVSLARLDPSARRRARGEIAVARVDQGFSALMDDERFVASISVGTSQFARVSYRFRQMNNMLREALS